MEVSDPRVQRSRAAILSSALALFIEGGVSAVTMDAVAARSGVAKTTIYRHWDSRSALLLDVFRQFDHRFVRDETLPDAEQLKDLLQQLARTFRSPAWQPALAALLDVIRRIDEFAELHEIMPPGGGTISVTLRRLADGGRLPAGVGVEEAMLQLVGPLVFGALLDPTALTDDMIGRMVDRLIQS